MATCIQAKKVKIVRAKININLPKLGNFFLSGGFFLWASWVFVYLWIFISLYLWWATVFFHYYLRTLADETLIPLKREMVMSKNICLILYIYLIVIIFFSLTGILLNLAQFKVLRDHANEINDVIEQCQGHWWMSRDLHTVWVVFTIQVIIT